MTDEAWYWPTCQVESGSVEEEARDWESEKMAGQLVLWGNLILPGEIPRGSFVKLRMVSAV